MRHGLVCETDRPDHDRPLVVAESQRGRHGFLHQGVQQANLHAGRFGVPCRARRHAVPPPCAPPKRSIAATAHANQRCARLLRLRVPSPRSRLRRSSCSASSEPQAVPGQCRAVCRAARRKGEREGVRSTGLGAFRARARRPMRVLGCRSSSCSARHNSTSNPKIPTSPGAAPRPLSVMGPPQPHPHRDWAHPSHIRTGTGPTPATSAPGLGSPSHIRTGTGLTRATSAPGLGPPQPHPHRDCYPVPHPPGLAQVLATALRSSSGCSTHES